MRKFYILLSFLIISLTTLFLPSNVNAQFTATWCVFSPYNNWLWTLYWSKVTCNTSTWIINLWQVHTTWGSYWATVKLNFATSQNYWILWPSQFTWCSWVSNNNLSTWSCSNWTFFIDYDTIMRTWIDWINWATGATGPMGATGATWAIWATWTTTVITQFWTWQVNLSVQTIDSNTWSFEPPNSSWSYMKLVYFKNWEYILDLNSFYYILLFSLVSILIVTGLFYTWKRILIWKN